MLADGINTYVDGFANSTKYGQGISVIRDIKHDLRNGLPYQYAVYEEIGNLLDRVSDQHSFRDGLHDIYLNAQANCPSGQKEALRNLISVAYSSYQYWLNNYDEWTDRSIMITMSDKSDEEKKKEEERRKRRRKNKDLKIQFKQILQAWQRGLLQVVQLVPLEVLQQLRLFWLYGGIN